MHQLWHRKAESRRNDLSVTPGLSLWDRRELAATELTCAPVTVPARPQRDVVLDVSLCDTGCLIVASAIAAVTAQGPNCAAAQRRTRTARSAALPEGDAAAAAGVGGLAALNEETPALLPTLNSSKYASQLLQTKIGIGALVETPRRRALNRPPAGRRSDIRARLGLC
jgi:hypothetical protein